MSDYSEVQLTDFGIARMQGGFETASGLFIGSVGYSPPDVLEGGPPAPSTDVYALGATLFTIIAGYAAFGREPEEELIAQYLRIRNRPVPDLRGRGVPDDLCTVLEQAMAKDPADRPQMTEFGRALQQVQERAGLAVAEMAVPAAPQLPSGLDRDPATPGGPPGSSNDVPAADLQDVLRSPVLRPASAAPPIRDRPAPAPETPTPQTVALPGPSAPPPATMRLAGPARSAPPPDSGRPAGAPEARSSTPSANTERRWPRVVAVAVLVLLLVGAITLALVLGARAISATVGAGTLVESAVYPTPLDPGPGARDRRAPGTISTRD
jgi:non-specific serine/threonine protein kinase